MEKDGSSGKFLAKNSAVAVKKKRTKSDMGFPSSMALAIFSSSKLSYGGRGEKKTQVGIRRRRVKNI